MAKGIEIIRTVADLRRLVAQFRSRRESVALIPTMGALHEGHLALVRAGQTQCRRTIATIFVNPLQFGPKEDLQAYPRDEAGDLEQLRRVNTDAVYLPTVEEMYPPGSSTTVTVTGLTEGLCGKFRPGHFQGVATVVAKLLLQALPDVALFGEKDYQQLQVIKRMARDLNIPVTISGVPTVRETDGLALSSRNRYLTPEQRRSAPLLHQVLDRVAAGYGAGQAPAPLLKTAIADLERGGFGPIQYVEICDAETLAPVTASGIRSRVLAAAYLGKTRLIDNVPAVPA